MLECQISNAKSRMHNLKYQISNEKSWMPNLEWKIAHEKNQLSIIILQNKNKKKLGYGHNQTVPYFSGHKENNPYLSTHKKSKQSSYSNHELSIQVTTPEPCIQLLINTYAIKNVIEFLRNWIRVTPHFRGPKQAFLPNGCQSWNRKMSAWRTPG